VRGLPAIGLLDRCTATRTCPKIIEHFGSAEVWALKLTPSGSGTDARQDLPLPPTCAATTSRRPTHGGGAGGFDSSVPGAALPAAGPTCPGNNYGTGLLPANPVPHTRTVNALRVHFRNWVMKDIAPPPSRWPTLADGTLAAAHKDALGFPTLPQLRPTVPEPDFIMPVLDYDWGTGFQARRRIRRGIEGAAADPPGAAHARAQGGCRRQRARWRAGRAARRTAGHLPRLEHHRQRRAAFHQGQICNYVGGMVPFARTAAQRQASGDPRPSLEERYRSHDGYVEAVRQAAGRAQQAGFLLKDDAERLVREAAASQVLR
jgi:hypothetical protein